MKQFLSKRAPLLWVCLVYAALAIFVAAGGVDLVAGPGAYNRWLILVSLTLYWAGACVAIGFILTVRRHWRTWLLAVVSCAFAFLIGEIAVRWLFPTDSLPEYTQRYSEKYHHVLPANSEMYHGKAPKTGEIIRVRTNEDGFRTPYSPEAFREYETRIIVLGDSFAFGLYNREQDALPKKLEALLRDQLGTEDLAVLNAGVVSYSPLIQKLVLQDVVDKYRPTHVLLLLDATDIGDDHEYANLLEETSEGIRFPRERTTFSSILPSGKAMLEASALFQRIRMPLSIIAGFVLRPLSMASTSMNPLIVHDVEIDGRAEDNRFFIYRHPLEKTRTYFETTLDHITDVANVAESAGADFTLLVTPRYHHWNPKESPRNWELYAYDVDEPYQFEYFRFFEEAADKVDYTIFSLLPAFRSAEKFPLVFRTDPHWNADGHAVAARAVADFLTSEGLGSAKGQE